MYIAGVWSDWKGDYLATHSCSVWIAHHHEFYYVPLNSRDYRNRLDGTCARLDCFMHANRQWKKCLCKLLNKLVEDTRMNVCNETSPSWFADDQSLEKMGALMSENSGRLLGLYDELAMFLSQMNIFHGKGITDSRKISVFIWC